ncbi:MAG: hypothetical protein K0R51_2370 [Cytophagaceae bacterium]|jgi:hypothetical protein|nr:hypothetical protein [Cytophagaceae bacterium]
MIYASEIINFFLNGKNYLLFLIIPKGVISCIFYNISICALFLA